MYIINIQLLMIDVYSSAVIDIYTSQKCLIFQTKESVKMYSIFCYKN